MRDTLVPVGSRRWLATGALVFVGALGATGGLIDPVLLLVIAGVGLLFGALPESVVVALLAMSVALNGPTLIEPGPLNAPIVLTSDIASGEFGSWATGLWGGEIVYLDLPSGESANLGDIIDIDGLVTGETRRYRGKPVSMVTVGSYVVDGRRSTGFVAVGNSMRSAVLSRLDDGSEPRGLLAGFLVGETSDLSEVTMADMRAAGLSHFVAVSGSNVALYLGFVAALTLPLGVGPKRRAAFGLVSLPVFVVATRFEPSVIRASAMAGLVLLGKLAGLALETWQVVGLSVTALLLLDPWLASSIGFQLSVAATCGVIVGARWPGRRGWVLRTLFATAGAQIAVAPLLLYHFGSVPLFGPLTNLVAAPLVAGSTILATLGIIGLYPLIIPASSMARWVIEIADTAAPWPQLNGVQLAVFLAAAVFLARISRTRREYVAVAVAIAVVIAILPIGQGLRPGEVAVLDVGQGDAILLSGGEDRYALVDGGPDPAVLVDHLRRIGVRHLSLVILSHVHADHAKGLTGLFGRIGVEEIWMNVEPHETGASEELLALAQRYGTPVRVVGPGVSLSLGELSLEVVGPRRRYASPNDQSVIVKVSGLRREMLLSGDVEVFAQRDLFGITADILKVPHQGAATSDPEWLQSVGADVAIISVGENNFGHPADWVIDLLVSSGARVMRTDLAGTVVVDLG